MRVMFSYLVECDTGLIEFVEVYNFDNNNEAEIEIPFISLSIKEHTNSPVFPKISLVS